jgi:hypothetical protein
MADSQDILHLLESKLGDEDKAELQSFLAAVRQSPDRLTVTIPEKGPTNGGKSSFLVVKLKRDLTHE